MPSRAKTPSSRKTKQKPKARARAAPVTEPAKRKPDRALEAGAKPEELYHTLLLLTSTIGFPTVSAALSWIDDVLADKRK